MDTTVTSGHSQVPPVSTPQPQPSLQTGGPTTPAAALDLFGHLGDGPNANAGVQDPAAKPRHTIADYGGGLDKGIDDLIKGDFKLRGDLDAQKKANLPTAAQTGQTLDADRLQLLGDLKERHGVYGDAIKEIDDKLGNKTPKNPTPEEKALLQQRAQLTQSDDKYAAQRTALQRWDDRNHINEINEKLKDPKLDAKAKADLLADKKTLATGLLSTTKHYEQFDERWGDTIYGKGKGYTSMRAAGCGPTALADLLDFADQEDPEGKHAQGEKDPFTPRKVADYATNHGRVKGNGTDGTTMLNDLSTGFPGYTGNTVNGRDGAAESLANGVPVMFVGHNITGAGGDGKNVHPYAGHFMVLDGVSDDKKTFKVEDGGRNESHNIRNISSKQLDGHVGGYWNVGR